VTLTATIHRFEVALSDVDRAVYETLDFRVARHPSESMRYLVTRTLAYCLAYEDGIAFSKGGISSTDEPPLAIHDPTGVLLVWIDIGSPSAERLHKASKAAKRVMLFTSSDLAQLRREAATRAIHRAETIDVWRFDPALLDDIAAKIDRTTTFELVRNDGRLYVTMGAARMEGEIVHARLSEAP
jgi:uncharacterized protein YaeQ